MGRIGRLAAVVSMISILGLSGISRAENLSLIPLEGAWYNIDPNTQEIVTIIIAEAEGMQIQVFSACPLGVCDWGVIPTTAYGRNESAVKAKSFLAIYNTERGESAIAGFRQGAYLIVNMFTMPVSGRSNPLWTGLFRKE